MEARPVRRPPPQQGDVGIDAYARAKLLRLLWTLALGRRLDGTGVVANATNPGMAWTPGTQALPHRGAGLAVGVAATLIANAPTLARRS